MPAFNAQQAKIQLTHFHSHLSNPAPRKDSHSLRSLLLFSPIFPIFNVDGRSSGHCRGLLAAIPRRHSSLHLQPVDYLVPTNESVHESRLFPGASLFGGSAYLWWLGAVKMMSIPSVRFPPRVIARKKVSRGQQYLSHGL